MENLNLTKIDEALNNLENSFKAFQQKQDHRFNQTFLAQNRPLMNGGQSEGDSLEKKAFLNYVGKGFEGYDQKSLTSQEGSRGGYFIPQPMMEHIQQTLLQASPLRNLARVTRISGDSLELLLDKGCADVGWVGEVEDRPETTTPELMKLRIPTHQIYAKPRASQKLLDDASIDLESWLIGKIADKIARTETAAFIHGDGNGKPKGFLSYPLVEAGSKEGGKIETFKSGADGELSNADVLLDVLSAMKPEYLSGSVWMMSCSAMAAIRRLKDRSTGNFLWQPGLLAGQPHTLLGHAVVVVDEMPALVRGKASTAVAFANFREGYQIVDRGDIHVLRDPYSAKPYVEFYTTKRVGGDVINTDAIKVVNFTKE